MREIISFEKVETKEQWHELHRFAASFGHKVDETSLTPLIACRRGQKMFAYFFVMNYPVVMPSFHPQFTTRRDFVEVIEQVRAWGWLRSIGDARFPQGTFWSAFPVNPVIDKELIKKMGFKSTNCELWQSYPGII